MCSGSEQSTSWRHARWLQRVFIWEQRSLRSSRKLLWSHWLTSLRMMTCKKVQPRDCDELHSFAASASNSRGGVISDELCEFGHWSVLPSCKRKRFFFEPVFEFFISFVKFYNQANICQLRTARPQTDPSHEVSTTCDYRCYVASSPDGSMT